MNAKMWCAVALDHREERFIVGRWVEIDGKWDFVEHNRTYKTLASASQKASQLNRKEYSWQPNSSLK